MARPKKSTSNGRGRPRKTSNNHSTLTGRLSNDTAQRRMENLRTLREARRRSLENEINEANGLNTDGSLYNLEEMKSWNNKFHSELNKEKYESCLNCKRRFFNLSIKEGLCKSCSKTKDTPEFEKFTKTNEMDPLDVPECLKKLNAVEQLLIALIHPQLFVYHLSGGQLGYKGHVINFYQNVFEFAKILPHKIATLTNMIIVKTSEEISIDDMKINKKLILDALIWLKSNNDYYKEIEINMNNLDDDNNSNINEINALNHLPNQHIEENEEIDDSDSNLNNILTYSDVPNLMIPNSNRVVYKRFGIDLEEDQVIDWPQRDPDPVNEFECKGFICMAFPVLFPRGKADFKEPRKITVTLKEYFEHLMLYKDRRFSKDFRFRYFAMNMLMRWETISNTRICIKKSQLNNLTEEEVKHKLINEPSFIKSILAYNQNVRSTSNYWYARSRELLNMIETIGPPTIFFTLSAADLFWPEIFTHLNVEYNIDNNLNQNQIIAIRRRILNENPLEFAYFSRKEHIFL